VVNVEGVAYLKDIVCKKCGGKGYIPEYKHIQEGICFWCWGSGSHSLGSNYPKLIPLFKKVVEEKLLSLPDIVSISSEFITLDSLLRQAEIDDDLEGVGYYNTRVNELVTKVYKLHAKQVD